MFAALVAYFWLNDRLTATRIVGLVIGFGGVLLSAWDKISFSGGSTTLAVLAALGASLSYGLGMNYTKKKLSGVPPLAAATGSSLAATLLINPARGIELAERHALAQHLAVRDRARSAVHGSRVCLLFPADRAHRAVEGEHLGVPGPGIRNAVGFHIPPGDDHGAHAHRVPDHRARHRPRLGQCDLPDTHSGR